MSDSQITKRALAEAMKTLMVEKPMEKIGVGEIVGRCGLNRKSFYYHFRDKYHLVNWIFYTEVFTKIQAQPTEDPWESLSTICEYLYENKVFYCNALRVNGPNSFSDWFMEFIQQIVKKFFDETFAGKADKDFYTIYCADATRVAIRRWLLEDARIPPDRFVALMKTAVHGIALKIASEIADFGGGAR